MTRSLPARPSLSHLKNEAKSIRKRHRAADTTVCGTLRRLSRFEGSEDDEILAVKVTLLEVQQALAVEYGFPSWGALKHHVESSVPRIVQSTPVFGIGSYAEAVAHYVDWLGFELDWEWREAPGRPVIMALSLDAFRLMLNEYPGINRHSSVHLKVTCLEAFAREWNAKRPGCANIRIDPPYEFPDLPIVDPFGNTLVFEAENPPEEQASRKSNRERMRSLVQARLDAGEPFPTPEEVRAAVGPDLGTAIEVLNEFDGYGEAFAARRSARREQMRFEIVELAAQPALVVARRTSLPLLAGVAAETLPSIQEHLAMRGHEPADRPFVRFDPPRDTGVSVQVGYPVPEGVSGAGEVELGELPACRAATAVCEGTAEELLSAWYELVDYASDHGRARGPGWGGSGGWHVYLGDPPESAESRVEVRLVLPLETARESGVS